MCAECIHSTIACPQKLQNNSSPSHTIMVAKIPKNRKSGFQKMLKNLRKSVKRKYGILDTFKIRTKYMLKNRRVNISSF